VALLSFSTMWHQKACLVDFSRNHFSMLVTFYELWITHEFYFGQGHRSDIELSDRKKVMPWIFFYDGTKTEVLGSQTVYNTADLSLVNSLIDV
jgi:hypothetical protein